MAKKVLDGLEGIAFFQEKNTFSQHKLELKCLWKQSFLKKKEVMTWKRKEITKNIIIFFTNLNLSPFKLRLAFSINLLLSVYRVSRSDCTMSTNWGHAKNPIRGRTLSSLDEARGWAIGSRSSLLFKRKLSDLVLSCWRNWRSGIQFKSS